MTVKTAVNFGHFDGIVAFRNRLGPVEDFVATAFEVAAPVSALFGKFRAARNDDFFHDGPL